MYAKVVPTVLSIRDTGSFTRSLLLSIYRACHSNLGKSISESVKSMLYTDTCLVPEQNTHLYYTVIGLLVDEVWEVANRW